MSHEYSIHRNSGKNEFLADTKLNTLPTILQSACNTLSFHQTLMKNYLPDYIDRHTNNYLLEKPKR